MKTAIISRTSAISYFHKLRNRLLRQSYTLSIKLITLCVIATVGALALTFALFQWQDWSADRGDLVREELGTARGLAAAASLAVERHDSHAAARVEAIFENDGQALAASYVSVSGQRLDLTRPGHRPFSLKPSGDARSAFGARGLEIHLPTSLDGHGVGELVMVVSEADIERSLGRNVVMALGLALFSATLAGLAARVVVRGMLGPLSELGEAIDRIGRTKDFSVRVRPRSSDEIGQLSRGFNALLGELQAYDGELQRTMSDLTGARDAAQEANLVKSQFLANMSHEIRTPLNGVLGMAQILAASELNTAQAEQLDVIQKSGATLLSVLNDLLDLSKIEAGRMELEAAPFDIGEVAQGAYATFTSMANASGVSFSMTIDEAAAGLWRGDSVRVRQVLYNLISNALKFTSEGEVRVAIDSTPSVSGKDLTLTIRDTGVGIAPEALATLFDKFVQADNTMTRRFGGTGLGLTICKQIVELMGGSIAVESQLGEGAVFQVRLPLPWLGPVFALPAPTAAEDQVPGTSLEGLRVLAAEDNATNQLVLKTVLHSLGVQPVVVENGRLAVEAWAQAPFDLILMDVQMPEMDGVAATQEIRRREAETGAGRTPIVALSANVMKHQVAEYLAAGMDAHLAKPINVAQLYDALLSVRTPRELGQAEAA
ncbi:ATP-binding protein [Phenylobacterium sp.]|uniref:ATP-binding protein n=1 Tax=Phenylobacterium sp. TaxID=1871053 RepID=UPI0012287EA6|nr:ATP-binding protein [Phenylobacterium sp.]THD60607.1 MAG: response regulator [Phenylobacterium sp.]